MGDQGSGSSGRTVLAVASLRDYFREALHDALDHQQVAVDAQTEHYVVNLLTLFARADELHAGEPAGRAARPLALRLADALEAATPQERCVLLQRLGDLSLFFAGCFARSFARRLVDVDYHVAMGGRAYATLADTLGRGPRRALAGVFDELSRKFQPLVDALGEVSDAGYRYSQADTLRLYEIWLKTGSPRARRLLGDIGVTPAPIGRRTH
ncbi:MAG: hypothetical protein R3E65_12955 [Steroidobacteraceae bacterium]